MIPHENKAYKKCLHIVGPYNYVNKAYKKCMYVGPYNYLTLVPGMWQFSLHLLLIPYITCTTIRATHNKAMHFKQIRHPTLGRTLPTMC